MIARGEATRRARDPRGDRNPDTLVTLTAAISVVRSVS
jgi:hypothetical protein